MTGWINALAGFICAVCVMVAALARPSLASDLTPELEAKNRISLAARQGTLTQQISRDACFVMAGILPDRFAESALSAVRQFDATLHGLGAGDENLRIGPEPHLAVLEQLERGKEIWLVLGPASQQVAAGDLHSVPMQQFLTYGAAMREHAQTLATTSVSVHGATIDESLAKTIGAASRLSTLALQASKDICFVALSIDPQTHRASMAQSIAEIDGLMSDLLHGAPERSVLAPPNRNVKRQLQRVSRAWTGLSAVLEDGLDAENLDEPQRIALANRSTEVMLETKIVISMYLY